MTYKLIIRNSDNTLQWELPFDSFSFTEELNKDRSARFSLNKQTIEAIADVYGVTVEFILSSSYREVLLYDEDDNLIYGGYVSEIQFTGASDAKGVLTVSSKGFFSLLDKRITNSLRTYTSQDASDIAWDLINYTQGLDYGDFGITRGADPTTTNRDRTLRYENIKDVIEKMSASHLENGFDFEVDNDKVFNIYYPEKGTKRNNIVLEYGHNMENYQINKTFINSMANQVTVFGEGFGDDMVVSTRDADDTYKNQFFLLQETLPEKNVSVLATLQDRGDKYLETYRQPRYTISCECNYSDPLFTNFNIGDRLRVIIPPEGIDDFFRLTKRSLTDKNSVSLSFEAK